VSEKQGSDLIGRKAGEFRLIAVDEPPAPTRTAIRDNGYAGSRERIHVAQYSALGDLKALGQLARGEPAVNLQQQ
jgi:hypothetical protein